MGRPNISYVIPDYIGAYDDPAFGFVIHDDHAIPAVPMTKLSHWDRKQLDKFVRQLAGFLDIEVVD